MAAKKEFSSVFWFNIVQHIQMIARKMSCFFLLQKAITDPHLSSKCNKIIKKYSIRIIVRSSIQAFLSLKKQKFAFWFDKKIPKLNKKIGQLSDRYSQLTKFIFKKIILVAVYSTHPYKNNSFLLVKNSLKMEIIYIDSIGHEIKYQRSNHK